MNMQELADILEFDIEDVEILMDMFINDTKESLKTVEAAINSDDFVQIRNIAHGIKGSALNLMLKELGDISLQIEQLAKTEIRADYNSLFKKLESELAYVEEIKAIV